MRNVVNVFTNLIEHGIGFRFDLIVQFGGVKRTVHSESGAGAAFDVASAA
jgi:hypothetical protein